MPLSPESKLSKTLRSKRDLLEGLKLSSSNSITRSLLMIKRNMRNWLINSSSRRRKDRIRWGKLSGNVSNRPRSIYWRTSMHQERRIFFWSRIRRRKLNGSSSTRKHKLKLLLLNKVLSTKLVPPRRPHPERTIRWISLSRWMRKTASKEHTSKRKCSRKEPLNWLS